MRNQYTSVSISGYDASPPPDDGSQTSANRVEWAKHKNKHGDPIKTLAESINTQANAAFGKLPFYDKNTTAVAYTATAADDGKFITFTATANLTLASATTLGEGWTTIVHNENSSGFVGISLAATDKLAGATDAGIVMPGGAALIVSDGTDRFSALFGGARITTSVLTGSATTWSKTGVKQALVFTQAGGGGGGSADTANISGGGGGGGGACAIKFFTATGFATFATTEACRVATGGPGGSGAAGTGGGDSIFGAGTGILSATGGGGGARDNNADGANGGIGGAAPGTGDLKLVGGGGGAGSGGSGASDLGAGGAGGGCFLGGGAAGVGTANTNGLAGGQYGGGGGGAYRLTGDGDGGAGAAGAIYIIEWR